MNIGDMIQAIYNKQNIPSGMYRKILSSTNMATELANTIIDYTKLTSDSILFLH